MKARLAIALALFFASGVARAAPERTDARALIIAVNDPGAPGLAPLRFADDDGLRWAETLSRLGVEATLLTVLDDETARIATAPAGTLPPTVENLHRAVERLRAANEESRRGGAIAETWVVYVGHGVLDEGGRAALTLLDGRLDQKALYSEVVDPLRADYVHLVVDACHAAGVVGRRGASGDPVVARLRERLAGEALKSRPTVGAIFAESEDGETHEWTRLRAGVFSFLARSALLGAADVNGDGVIEYSELDAYVGAALQRVTSYPARLAIYSYAPPADRRRPLSRLGASAPRLASSGEQEGEAIVVEDESGTPLAGFHRAPVERVSLLLPARPLYWLRTSKQEAKVALADVARERFEWRPRSLNTRGPVEDELERGLLGLRFGRDFYDGFVARSPHVPVPFIEEARLATQEAPSPWSAEIGASVGAPTLGLSGLAGGVSVAVHRAFGVANLGARAGYALAPKAGAAELAVHRASVEAVVGVEGPFRIRPMAELGLGWLLVAFPEDGRTEGDPLGFTAHVAAGAGVAVGPLTLRLAALLALDVAKVDEAHHAYLSPGGSLSVSF